MSPVDPRVRVTVVARVEEFADTFALRATRQSREEQFYEGGFYNLSRGETVEYSVRAELHRLGASFSLESSDTPEGTRRFRIADFAPELVGPSPRTTGKNGGTPDDRVPTLSAPSIRGSRYPTEPKPLDESIGPFPIDPLGQELIEKLGLRFDREVTAQTMALVLGQSAKRPVIPRAFVAKHLPFLDPNNALRHFRQGAPLSEREKQANITYVLSNLIVWMHENPRRGRH